MRVHGANADDNVYLSSVIENLLFAVPKRWQYLQKKLINRGFSLHEVASGELVAYSNNHWRKSTRYTGSVILTNDFGIMPTDESFKMLENRVVDFDSYKSRYDVTNGYNRAYYNDVQDAILKILCTDVHHRPVQNIDESKTIDNKLKLFLDENEHVEWSRLHKIAKSANDGLIIKKQWNNLDQKLMTLCAESRGSKIIATSAHDALSARGNKSIAWVDVDVTDHERFYEWFNDQKLINRLACRIVESTSNKIHMYINLDRRLKQRWQYGLKSQLRASMKSGLSEKVDCVYGQESRRIMYLPQLSLLEAIPPQSLLADANETFKLDVDVIEDPCYALFKLFR